MEVPRRPAPYRVETERLVLRCPELTDLEPIHESVLESVESLRPWMPWVADEPSTLAQRADVIRRLRTGFDRQEDLTYMLYDRASGGHLGGAGLHPRVGPGGIELGYWIRESAQGQGLAGEATQALLRVAFQFVGVDRVEIRIEPSNRASRRVVEKLEIPREAVLRRRFPRAGDLQDVEVYSVFASDFAASPERYPAVRAYNPVGEEIPAPAPR